MGKSTRNFRLLQESRYFLFTFSPRVWQSSGNRSYGLRTALYCGKQRQYWGIFTEETGFKIEPNSREYLTQELTKKIKILVEDDRLRENMSAKSIERAKEFEWDNKAIKIVEIYEKMLAQKARVLTKNK